jgi:hypothetical protein
MGRDGIHKGGNRKVAARPFYVENPADLCHALRYPQAF